MPLVSIIIPVYNVEKYLRECLDSALNQSYENLEILCVDDGSTDTSPEILKEYSGRDKRVHVVSKENGGLSSARNAGLSVAKGEYIYYLDSDDCIVPAAMERCVETSERESLDVLLFNAATNYESEEIKDRMPEYAEYYVRKGPYDGVMSGRELFCHMIKNHEYRSNVGIQFARSIFLADKGFGFEEGVYFEDNAYTLKLMLLAKRAMHIEEQLFLRRFREDSITTSGIKAKEVYSLYRTFKSMQNELLSHDLTPEEQAAGAFLLKDYQYYAATQINKADEEQRRAAAEMMGTKDALLFGVLLESLADEATEKQKAIKALDGILYSKSYRLTSAVLKPFRSLRRTFKRQAGRQ